MTTNVSRRTLVKGAAWATPVVAATAIVPAYAASSSTPQDCTSSDVRTGTYAQGSFNSADYTYSMAASFSSSTGDSISATITTARTVSDFGLVYNESARKGFYSAAGKKTYSLLGSGVEETNMTLASSSSRCGASQAMMLSQESRQNAGQTVTFKFSEAVSAVQFTIYDIDQIYGAYNDQVVVAATNGNVNFTFADSSGNGQVTLSNSGTSAATATAISGSTQDYGADSACYHPLLVTICANTSEGFDSFTLTYTSTIANAVLANRKVQMNQMISVGPLKITPSSCAPSSCGGTSLV